MGKLILQEPLNVCGVGEETRDWVIEKLEEVNDIKLKDNQKDILKNWMRVASPPDIIVLGTREAGDLIGKSQNTIREWIKKGKIRGARNIEGLWWVPVEDLVAML